MDVAKTKLKNTLGSNIQITTTLKGYMRQSVNVKRL